VKVEISMGDKVLPSEKLPLDPVMTSACNESFVSKKSKASRREAAVCCPMRSPLPVFSSIMERIDPTGFNVTLDTLVIVETAMSTLKDW